jgi:hypothetical protein
LAIHEIIGQCELVIGPWKDGISPETKLKAFAAGIEWGLDDQGVLFEVEIIGKVIHPHREIGTGVGVGRGGKVAVGETSNLDRGIIRPQRQIGLLHKTGKQKGVIRSGKSGKDAHKEKQNRFFHWSHGNTRPKISRGAGFLSGFFDLGLSPEPCD